MTSLVIVVISVISQVISMISRVISVISRKISVISPLLYEMTEQKLISDCRYRVIESSSLVPALFREVVSHPYISFIHLLVNGFSVTCFRTFFS